MRKENDSGECRSLSPVTVTKVKEKLLPGLKGTEDDGLERKMVAEEPEQPDPKGWSSGDYC